MKRYRERGYKYFSHLCRDLKEKSDNYGDVAAEKDLLLILMYLEEKDVFKGKTGDHLISLSLGKYRVKTYN